MIIELGIHPCVDSINCANLAFQGHCRRVTHSFQNVSLLGDSSLNPGSGSSITPPGYKFTHVTRNERFR